MLNFRKIKIKILLVCYFSIAFVMPAFSGTLVSSQNECIKSLNGEISMPASNWSRRRFLKSIGIFGAQMSLGPLVGKALDGSGGAEVDTKKKIELGPSEIQIRENLKGAIDRLDINAEDFDRFLGSYTGTFTEGNLVILAKMVAANLIKNSGNAGQKADPEYFNDPQNILMIGFIGPLIEEVLFRLIPAGFGTDWSVGIPATIIFAGVHNIVEVDGKVVLDLKTIPVTQFMGGVFYWYLMKYKGLDHAILAHMQNNLVATIASQLGRIFP